MQKGQSETVNYRRKDNNGQKGKKGRKRQTMIYKTLHRKPTIDENKNKILMG
jgi:hypothetical protein